MKNIVEQLLQQALNKLGWQDKAKVHVERTKDTAHGDLASNVALLLAKPCGQAPRAIAEQIKAAIPNDALIAKVEIAGPGFLNFFVKPAAHYQILPDILTQGEKFGHNNTGLGQKVLLEYLSCNPTGPLHVGHGRNAAFGATLANIMRASGFDVCTEYYVNDAGRQMDILALSVWLRYLELLGASFTFPPNCYQGDYVADIASQLITQYERRYWHENIFNNLTTEEDSERLLDALIAKAKQLLGTDGFAVFLEAALAYVLADIKNDLQQFGVEFDNWYSERQLVTNGAIDKGIVALKAQGHTFEQEGALWFRATAFNDEKDRVLVRANRLTTYFASDVAYHWDKYARGFDKVINIFGADHHGYVTRLRAAVTALGHDATSLNILLVQFANLYRGQEKVQMSTRSGNYITLRDLLAEVGTDAARFFYVARKADQHMDFDLELAKQASNENPVYYIQYAHARICSVFRQLQERGLSFTAPHDVANFTPLVAPHELTLVTQLAQFPEVVALAAARADVHLLSFYLRELAANLHSYYNAIIILCEDEDLRTARLALLKCVQQVLFNGLQLLGVSAPRSM